MDMIKFAIIGQGHIGKRHAEMVRRNPGAELVAVCDVLSKSQTGNAEIKESYYQSVDELLNQHADVDVVSVCTPNGLHAAHALKVLEASKHVVMEKPMALLKSDCENIIYKALQNHRQVFCVMQNRYSPPAVWVKDVVDKKIIGEVFMVQLNCYWNRDERYYKNGGWKGTQHLDGGTLFTQFSHWIDLLYWLFGDIKNIQAKFQDFKHENLTEFEDSGFISFDFVNGGMGSINYSTAIAHQNLESSMTIIGKNGSVKIGGQYMNEVEVCTISNYTMPVLKESNPANDYGPYKGSAANHNYVISNVINTLKGRTSATTNALEGMKVVEIIERIYKVRNESMNL